MNGPKQLSPSHNLDRIRVTLSLWSLVTLYGDLGVDIDPGQPGDTIWRLRCGHRSGSTLDI